jgi:hypothetical protein
MNHKTGLESFEELEGEGEAEAVPAPKVRLPIARAEGSEALAPARPRTLSMRGAVREETLRLAAEYPEGEFADVVRPRTRADCLPGGINGERPCPFVSCAAHLALDVQAHGTYASLKLNFPDVEIWDMAETCMFDVADRGGASLDEVAALMNVSEERVRQIEVHALGEIESHPWTREVAAEGE